MNQSLLGLGSLLWTGTRSTALRICCYFGRMALVIVGDLLDVWTRLSLGVHAPP
jgi:hypothetical protein